MGVTGLWCLLSPVQEYVSLHELSGQSLAVDLSTWICEDMCVKYNSTVALKLYLRNLFFRVISLLKNNVLVVGVTDGEAPELKSQAMDKRNMARFKREVKPKRTKSYKRKQFSRISMECCYLLELLGVSYVRSPGEAESMCALLNSKKVVDACITNDGDAFLYGAEKVYKNFTMSKKDAHVELYETSRVTSELGLSREHLVALALLLGSDYDEGGVPGVGKDRAVKFLRCLPTDVDVLQVLREMQSDGEMNFDTSEIPHFSAIRQRIKGHPNFPNNDIIEEFLVSNADWPIPGGKLEWKKPDVQKTVIINMPVSEIFGGLSTKSEGEVYASAEVAAVYNAGRPTYPEEILRIILDFYCHGRSEGSRGINVALDVGCGSGQFTRILAPYCRRIIGSDISQVQIAEARKLKTEDIIEYRMGTCYDLGVESGSIDLVTVATALHRFDDIPRFMKEVDRCLRQDGVLLYFTYLFGNTDHLVTKTYLKYIHGKNYLKPYCTATINTAQVHRYNNVQVPYPDSERFEFTKLLSWNLEKLRTLTRSMEGFQNFLEANPAKANDMLEDMVFEIRSVCGYAPNIPEIDVLFELEFTFAGVMSRKSV